MGSRIPPTSSFTTEHNTTDNTMLVPRLPPLVCSYINHVTRPENPKISRWCCCLTRSTFEFHTVLIPISHGNIIFNTSGRVPCPRGGGKCVLFWADSNFSICWRPFISVSVCSRLLSLSLVSILSLYLFLIMTF